MNTKVGTHKRGSSMVRTHTRKGQSSEMTVGLESLMKRLGKNPALKSIMGSPAASLKLKEMAGAVLRKNTKNKEYGTSC